MTQEHPITPSEDQIMLWCKQWNCTKEPGPIHKWLAIQAARWGADMELEACCSWADATGWCGAGDMLRDARRSKPPGLKEQALFAIDTAVADGRLSSDVSNVVRRALEALPD